MRFTTKICFSLLIVVSAAITALSQLRIENGLIVSDTTFTQTQVVDLTQVTVSPVASTDCGRSRSASSVRRTYDSRSTYIPRPTYYSGYGYPSYSSVPNYYSSNIRIPIPTATYGYGSQYNSYSQNTWQSNSNRYRDRTRRERRHWMKHHHWQR